MNAAARRDGPTRRHVLVRTIGAAAIAAPPLLLGACSPAPVRGPGFGSLPTALATLQALKDRPPRTTGAWDLAQVLHHAAQSVEYSMQGYPQPRPAWFRASVGPLAFALFSARGRMSHALDEPIPGAPANARGLPLAAAVDRVVAALTSFEAHTGALAPHFAYGALGKDDYRRAHLMHLANHWDELQA
ncbi:DUF1569 domain-containing protein [Piscinibacter defluvii]|uniref:DUF1569 domain-containing protein n=1 Tax=Piscinibacter defluvii TaxID=1796922 RepID=UPI000FDEFE28|nr:DUF1569 domain-containing protein [Piscinibacter defluvii]